MVLTKVDKTYLEDLSNEVIYEIFDYIDGFNIFNSFDNLNFRFNCLIKVFLPRSKKFLLEHNNTSDMKRFFRYYPLGTFKCLESLTIKCVYSSYLFNFGMDKFLTLKYLSLRFVIIDWDIKSLLNKQISSLPNLKTLKLKLSRSKTIQNLFGDSRDQNATKNEHLERFIVDSTLLSDIEIFSQLFPNLKSLNLSKLPYPLIDRNLRSLQTSTIEMARLTKFKLSANSIDFYYLRILLTKCPNLICFIFNCENSFSADGYRWEEVLSKMKSLSKFQLNVDTSIKGSRRNIKDHIDTIIESFQTNFWFQRQTMVSSSVKQRKFSLKINYS